MNMNETDTIKQLVGEIQSSYQKYPNTCNIGTQSLLKKGTIIDVLEEIRYIVFPGFFEEKRLNPETIEYHLGELLEDIQYRLRKLVSKALCHSPEKAKLEEEERNQEAEKLVTEFLKKIPAIREMLQTDVQAAYDGDPAAYNTDEVIFSYPGVFAISVNRIAHELFLLGVPLIPRIMTEHAHSLTGIDIHPGATIGKYFFIDHGTGVVIGETTLIGDNVKIYQGVTLGALSTRGGQSLRNVRRHPTLMDNVTVYSGASILGGDTIIGEGAVIGSNAFITSSVPNGVRVSIKSPELQFKDRSKAASSTVAELGQGMFWKKENQ